jgi:hypothetical protein
VAGGPESGGGPDEAKKPQIPHEGQADWLLGPDGGLAPGGEAKQDDASESQARAASAAEADADAAEKAAQARATIHGSSEGKVSPPPESRTEEMPTVPGSAIRAVPEAPQATPSWHERAFVSMGRKLSQVGEFKDSILPNAARGVKRLGDAWGRLHEERTEDAPAPSATGKPAEASVETGFQGSEYAESAGRRLLHELGNLDRRHNYDATKDTVGDVKGLVEGLDKLASEAVAAGVVQKDRDGRLILSPSGHQQLGGSVGEFVTRFNQRFEALGGGVPTPESKRKLSSSELLGQLVELKVQHKGGSPKEYLEDLRTLGQSAVESGVAVSGLNGRLVSPSRADNTALNFVRRFNARLSETEATMERIAKDEQASLQYATTELNYALVAKGRDGKPLSAEQTRGLLRNLRDRSLREGWLKEEQDKNNPDRMLLVPGTQNRAVEAYGQKLIVNLESTERRYEVDHVNQQLDEIIGATQVGDANQYLRRLQAFREAARRADPPLYFADPDTPTRRGERREQEVVWAVARFSKRLNAEMGRAETAAIEQDRKDAERRTNVATETRQASAQMQQEQREQIRREYQEQQERAKVEQEERQAAEAKAAVEGQPAAQAAGAGAVSAAPDLRAAGEAGEAKKFLTSAEISNLADAADSVKAVNELKAKLHAEQAMFEIQKGGKHERFVARNNAERDILEMLKKRSDAIKKGEQAGEKVRKDDGALDADQKARDAVSTQSGESKVDFGDLDAKYGGRMSEIMGLPEDQRQSATQAMLLDAVRDGFVEADLGQPLGVRATDDERSQIFVGAVEEDREALGLGRLPEPAGKTEEDEGGDGGVDTDTGAAEAEPDGERMARLDTVYTQRFAEILQRPEAADRRTAYARMVREAVREGFVLEDPRARLRLRSTGDARSQRFIDEIWAARERLQS